MYISLWIQTLSRKKLNPPNHSPVPLFKKLRLDPWGHGDDSAEL